MAWNIISDGLGPHLTYTSPTLCVQSKWEDADVAWDIIRKGPEPLRSQVRAATQRGPQCSAVL